MKNTDCGIYAIINNINQKLYIGSSCQIKRRICNHFSELRDNRHPNIYLQRAFSKYGEKNFEFKILSYCKREKLLDREQYYINYYQACSPSCGYNLSVTAKNSGKCRSLETKNKMSLGRKNKKRSLSAIQKTKKTLTNRPLSEENKKHIGNAIRKYDCFVVEWRELRRQGFYYREIAKKYNVSKSNVMNYLKVYFPEGESVENNNSNKHGIRKYTHLVEEWRNLKTSGMSYSDIGKKYNISGSSVCKYLVKFYPLKKEVTASVV